MYCPEDGVSDDHVHLAFGDIILEAQELRVETSDEATGRRFADEDWFKTSLWQIDWVARADLFVLGFQGRTVAPGVQARIFFSGHAVSPPGMHHAFFRTRQLSAVFFQTNVP